MSQLTVEQVASIRAMKEGGTSDRHICAVFGIGHMRLQWILLAKERGPSDRHSYGKRPEADAVDHLISQGVGPAAIARQLAVPLGYVTHRQREVAKPAGLRESTDSSCPKFAEHDACAKAVLACGGYPLAERVKGKTVWIDWQGRPWRQLNLSAERAA